jgi:hypothetical protein
LAASPADLVTSDVIAQRQHLDVEVLFRRHPQRDGAVVSAAALDVEPGGRIPDDRDQFSVGVRALVQPEAEVDVRDGDAQGSRPSRNRSRGRGGTSTDGSAEGSDVGLFADFAPVPGDGDPASVVVQAATAAAIATARTRRTLRPVGSVTVW